MPESTSRASQTSYHYGLYSSVDITGNLTANQHSSTSTSGTANVRRNTASGYKLPNWRDIVRAGGNATTNFSGTLYTSEASWFTAVQELLLSEQSGSKWSRQHYENYGYLPYDSYPSTPSISSGTITDATNRCIRRFLEEFEKAFSSDNLTGRSIKHFQHDVHSISNPMKGLRDEISSYLGRLGKVAQGKGPKSRLLREVRAAYLELTFGIQPFTDDITAILTDLGRYRFPSIPISAQATVSDPASSSTVDISSKFTYKLSRFLQTMVIASTYSVRYKGAVRTQTGMDGKIGFIQSQRLLPQDWVPTLFSILPYAWMVDYFTNIGDIIDGLCFCFNDLAWGCKTVLEKSSVTYSEVSILPIPPPGFPVVSSENSAYGGNAVFTCKTVNRSPLVPSDLVPRLVFTIPTRPKEWLNMMAVFQPRILKIVSSLI